MYSLTLNALIFQCLLSGQNVMKMISATLFYNDISVSLSSLACQAFTSTGRFIEIKIVNAIDHAHLVREAWLCVQ